MDSPGLATPEFVTFPASMPSPRTSPVSLTVICGVATVPPLLTVSEPAPKLPTASETRLVQVEPGPSTIVLPSDPAKLPTKPLVLETDPPLVMFSVPEPL